MTSRATIARKEQPYAALAGRAVIGIVLGCRQPVVYDSALRFIRLANLDLPREAWLDTPDIVACAFRLSEPEALLELGFKAADLAKACNLRRGVVEAAFKQLRITYVDAYAIWAEARRVTKERGEIPAVVSEVLTDDIADFVRTDTRGSIAVAVDKIGKAVPRHSKRAGPDEVDNAEYVYSRSNLRTAPPSGHPWALGQPYYPPTAAGA